MDCPHCSQELNYSDYYFTGNYSAYKKGYANNGFEKKGDIYKCSNEECESQTFNGHFYTKINSDELFEGYPC